MRPCLCPIPSRPLWQSSLLITSLIERAVLVRPQLGFVLFPPAPSATTLALRLPLASWSRHLRLRVCRCSARATIGRASPTR
jgi:hypothetical protein